MFCILTYFFLFPRPSGHTRPVRDISRPSGHIAPQGISLCRRQNIAPRQGHITPQGISLCHRQNIAPVRAYRAPSGAYRAARHIALPQAKYRVPSGAYRAARHIAFVNHTATLSSCVNCHSERSRRISYTQAGTGFFIALTLHSE